MVGETDPRTREQDVPGHPAHGSVPPNSPALSLLSPGLPPPS